MPSFRFLVFPFIAVCSVLAPALVSAGELKVDINRTTRNQATQTEPGYTMWSQVIPAGTGTETTGTAAATQTFTTTTGETLTISFSQTALSASRGGTGILSNWFQVGAQGTAKLVSDGITVNPATLGTGGEIQMTITGLSPGTHTLLTYHNAWDNLAAGTQGPIDIYVNGVLAADNVQPTIRAATNNAATVSYVEFTVGATTDVTTILFSAELSTAAARKNPLINGFEIDTPNSTRQAQNPLPANFDEHADADSGGLTLSWTGPTIGTAVSHDVYFGTNETSVRNANHSSPEFLGNQTALSRTVSGLNSHLSYYWRVDEIDGLSNVTKGPLWYFRTRQLAFPGAEGYGRFARGGREGRVVKVTSVADYTAAETPIPGTLRYAIEQETGPRTIVFDISGLITLASRLTINSPYLTIAGQTAPGKGITVRNYTIGLSGGRDIIVRYLRSRPGKISGTTIDGMGMQGSDHSILDHCSVSWSIDEAFSSRSAKNITLQRSLISEALNDAGHQNYPPGTEHGYAASIGGDKGSFHHNLLAHCFGRNWSLAGGLDGGNFFAGRLDITNNVVYNWGARTTDGGAMEVNFVNNYYKPGAGTTLVPYALTMNHEDNFAGSQRAYFAGNVMPGYFDETNQTTGRRSVVSSDVPTPTYETFVTSPFFASFVDTQTARDAYKRVLSDVGANAPLDDHDFRIITETLTGTFTYRGSATNKPGFPDVETDVGGWEDYPVIQRAANWDSDNDGLPDWWESLKGLNPNSPAGDFSDANADVDGDGYTNLDDYLHWLTLPRAECVVGGTVDIDLSKLTRGYTDGPVHTIGTVINGGVTLLADGKTAHFTPAASFTGLAQFSFTVTDSAGGSMTRTVGIHVLEAPPLRSYASWIAGYGLSVADQAPGADPDGDGLVNQLEFVLGLDPTASDSEGQPSGKLEGGNFAFRFVHDKTADAAFVLEESIDLINWTPSSASSESVTPEFETLTVLSPATAAKRFFRLTSAGFSTTPVGFLKTVLTGGQTTAFGLLLDDTGAILAGTRAGKIESLTANTLTRGGSAWTLNLANPANPWAVRIVSGAAAGKLFDISANTTTQLSVGSADLIAAGVVTGDRFELVPLDTLATFFGPSTLQGGPNAGSADVVQLRAGAAWLAYYYDTTLGFWRRTIGPATNTNNAIVRPGSGILILRRGSSLDFTVAGRVLGNSFRVAINNASTTGISAGFPTDTTLAGLGVQNLLGGWRAGTDTSTADAVGLYNGTSWTSYVFNGTHWQTTLGTNSDSIGVPAGSVLLVQRPGSASGTTDLVRNKVY